jgi:hypothetical protein
MLRFKERATGPCQAARRLLQAAFFQGAFVRLQIGLEIAMSMSRAKMAKPS